MSLEIRIYVIAALVLLAVAGIVYWDVHERGIGATKCEQADTKAADAELAEQAKQLATYKTQLEAADARHAEDLRIIAMAAASTPDSILCHETAPRAVPAVPVKAPSGPAAPGAADQVSQREFDPSTIVHGLSGVAEQALEQCRDALNRWPSQATH